MRLFLLSLLCALSACVSAQPVSKEDTAAIRGVIAQQLEAFRRDDGERAFALATAGIRAKFGSAAVFMQMVRTEYPVVYRPRSVQFEAPEVIDGAVVQTVRMVDELGITWLALYPMQRMPDGAWRIDGCYLQRAPGRQT